MLQAPPPPAAEPAGSPAAWWHEFALDYARLTGQPVMLFQRLSAGIERFRVEEWRKDPLFLKIWLAYLNAHYELYGDYEEVRRLFRFLQSEHVGTDEADLYLHYAQFELRAGKVEKCQAVLEGGLGVPKLSQNELLRRALLEVKLVGQFRIPAIETKDLPGMSNQSKMTQSPPILVDQQHAKQLIDEAEGSLSSASVPRISPELVTSTRHPSSSTRIRRLGNLGPPKRAIVPLNTISSPGDSTVPKARSDSQNSTPTRVNPTTEMMLLDKDSMSLTTISPVTIEAAGRMEHDKLDEYDIKPIIGNTKAIESIEDPTVVIKSRAVKVNTKTYKVLQPVGRGGSSKVFKVLSPENAILALKKVSLRNLDQVTLSGYINEINLLKNFQDSEHIIKLIDHEVNREHGNLYILMEYGEADLGSLLRAKQGRPRDYNFIRYTWQQMLLAVRTVHQAKIVHCDLKPANFLLVGGNLKLIDFGISKAIMNDTTNIVRENQVGTVNYMSPEALQESSSSERGKIKIGRPSDIWSLGCILYEMAYGGPPFAKFTLIQRLHKILDSSYEIEYGPTDPSLLDAVRGCLIRQPKRRLTLEDLLSHHFLNPPPSPWLPSPETALVSRRQIRELLERFARALPQLDTTNLAEKILQQWQRETP